ncbi:hypothetical protein H072_11352 [Dactylellina haptotyla CBS 200.50]|uniref:Uncharacterized protein n=1 Tax=Dactylellina haptotyla (strain CBS 200.50) TaxID=1284197 RepID=S8A284_DACHA|nr:hypothetical protein H072_11352 [Dactylellina haptotyla CBS 200.50]
MAADDSDYKSRLEATTRTGKGYYDQVLALSEKIINDSFQNLYSRYPDLGKLYMNDPYIGSCEIELDAPTIKIPSNAGLNFSKLFFIVNVKKGQIKSGDGILEATLDGWKLAVQVDFDVIKIQDPSKVTDPKTKSLMENENAWLTENFVPGDYTASRLFLKLSSSDWGKFDDENSLALDENKQPISIKVWMANNGFPGLRLGFFLKVWAEKKDGSGKNTLGYHFQAPDQPASPVPTYVPTALAHQIFPYKNLQKGAGQGSSDDSSIGTTRNALMYCEMVKNNPLPDDPKLVWSGNFITAPTTLNDPGINATFLISHQLFLKTHLLPELQALNWATDIYHDNVWIGESPNNDNMLAIGIPYSVGNGADPNHRGQTDEVFQFGPNEPDHPTAYVFSKKYAVANKPQVTSTIRPQGDCRLVAAEGGTVNTLTWSPGGTNLTISGVSYIYHRAEWARQSDPKNFNDLWGLLDERYDITWAIKFIVNQDSNGVLSIAVDPTTQDGNVNVTRKSGSFNLTQDSMAGLIEGYVKTNVQNSLPTAINNVKERLKGNGKFVFPATGYLDFSNVMFNNEGGLLAQVAYKPLPPDAPAATLPASTMALRLPALVQRKVTIATPTLVVPAQKLTWEPPKSFSGIALKKDSVFSFKGTNNTSDPILLKSITIEFGSDSTDGREMFASKTFEIFDDSKEPDTEETTDGNAETEGGEILSTDKAPADATETGSTESTHKPTLVGKLRAAIGGESSVPKPKITSTLKLTQSETITNAQLTVASQTTGKRTDWVVKISAVKDGVLTVPPGGWLNVDVTGDTGVSGTYKLLIDEVWSDDKGNVADHFAETWQAVLA